MKTYMFSYNGVEQFSNVSAQMIQSLVIYEIQHWHTICDTPSSGVTADLTESPPFDEIHCTICHAVLFYTESVTENQTIPHVRQYTLLQKRVSVI